MDSFNMAFRGENDILEEEKNKNEFIKRMSISKYYMRSKIRGKEVKFSKCWNYTIDTQIQFGWEVYNTFRDIYENIIFVRNCQKKISTLTQMRSWEPNFD